MKTETVSMVRIYLTEGEGVAQEIFRRLHDEERVRGVTLFRGVSGFGRSGKVHSSSLLDLSLDLPLVLEFFDAPDRVDEILGHLQDTIAPGHLVRWSAEVNR
jgi:PII-like signaling protein